MAPTRNQQRRVLLPLLCVRSRPHQRVVLLRIRIVKIHAAAVPNALQRVRHSFFGAAGTVEVHHLKKVRSVPHPAHG